MEHALPYTPTPCVSTVTHGSEGFHPRPSVSRPLRVSPYSAPCNPLPLSVPYPLSVPSPPVRPLSLVVPCHCSRSSRGLSSQVTLRPRVHSFSSTPSLGSRRPVRPRVVPPLSVIATPVGHSCPRFCTRPGPGPPVGPPECLPPRPGGVVSPGTVSRVTQRK